MIPSLGLELRRLFAAIQYFTRIPVPNWVGHSQDLLDDAARYFPAAGLLVGGIGALVLTAAMKIWPMPVAVVLSTIVTMLVTGAFHEDGLADAIDGLGATANRARALEIMKDSRIGVFGAAALMLCLTLKILALVAVTPSLAPWILIAGHTLSRWCAVLIMMTLPYVRETEDSRSKPLVRQVSIISVLTGGLMAALSVVPLRQRGIAAAAGALCITLAWRWQLKRRLQGYTGDCLGAAQQLSEAAFYLACAASW